MFPRWRDSRTTGLLGELDAVSRVEPSPVDPAILNDKLADWEANPSDSFAGDLLSTSIALGILTEAVVAVARSVIDGKTAGPALRAIAERVINPGALFEAENSGIIEGDSFKHRAQVQRIRKLLRIDPRNALARVDLALLRSSVGDIKGSANALRAAVIALPDDRFVLRAAARFFMHADDPEQALAVLRDALKRREDPWLIASEISIADAIDVPSRFAKTGRRLLSSADIGSRHLSELASALATLEFFNGSMREAKRLLKIALIAPNDNSVAQAIWAVRRFGIDPLEHSILDVPRSFEARALENSREGLFSEAVGQTWLWMGDQPFSVIPPLHGAFVSSTGMDDYATAEKLLMAARVSNRGHWLILNNLAFYRASLGDTESAINYLSLVSTTGGDERQNATLSATHGLVQFRLGNLEAGRIGYRKAVEVFDRMRNVSGRALASLYWAREEILSKTSAAPSRLAIAMDNCKAVTSAEILALAQRIEKMARTDQTGEAAK
jgi:tetratricopeptide (TPR) repeat protein